MSFTRVIRRSAQPTRAPSTPRPLGLITAKRDRPILHLKPAS